MEKRILAVATAAVLFSALSCGIANAADGQIKFTGSLTADACKVDTTSADQTVSMGKVAISAFTDGQGTKASPTKFSLKLTDCPDTVTSAVVKFDGNADASNTDLLALDSDSDAAGVGIEIADNTGAAIPIHQASTAYPLAVGDNTLEFVARYVSDTATVTAGAANATSDFTINYN
ncbi:fimbrial protein [Citrobacter youngae]|uniref:Fimbrial protein n=1 Tax=Citrobacter youngae ATCC 29220 TaxID=500640 RepID=D4B7R5_9ENTR|nr:fimbrial protein [Citrobacter youngae]EFE10418.1 fimbrial protein [Citrobacter youngae ATCC 29220]